jgi:hypothetical protein
MLGLSLMAVLDCGSTACFRFVREGTLGFGGEDNYIVEGTGGDHGGDGTDQFWVGHVRRRAWCQLRENPTGALS